MEFNDNKSSIYTQINKIKAQQDACTELLLEAITIRENYPNYTERADTIISRMEAKMSQNADLLAHLEAELGYSKSYAKANVA